MSGVERVVTEVKSHPYVVGGGVAVVLLFMYFRRGKSASGSSGVGGQITTVAQDPNMIAANLALQQAQLADQTQLSLANTAAGLTSQQTQAALQVDMANIAAQTSVTNSYNGAQVFAGLNKDYLASGGDPNGNYTAGIAKSVGELYGVNVPITALPTVAPVTTSPTTQTPVVSNVPAPTVAPAITSTFVPGAPIGSKDFMGGDQGYWQYQINGVNAYTKRADVGAGIYPPGYNGH